MLVKCDACNGDVSSEANICMTCGHPLNATYTGFRTVKVTCLSCQGRGYFKRFLGTTKCDSCDGQGHTIRLDEVELPHSNKGWHKP